MKVLVVYETKFGNTKKAAETIAEAIKEAGNDITLSNVSDVDKDTLNSYNGFIIGSPTYAGSPARSIKKFINLLAEKSVDGQKIVVFDTHSGDGVSKGGFLREAVAKMEKQIQKKAPKLDIILPGLQVAVIGLKGPIVDGELDKCKEFGQKIAQNL